MYVHLLANALLMLSHKTIVLSWAKLCVVNICVKNQQMQQLFIQFINYVW
jgi:hypothetical protein